MRQITPKPEQTTWDKQIDDGKNKYLADLTQYRAAYENDAVLVELVYGTAEAAASRSLNAAYGGEMGDGGARSSIDQLARFLDGVLYAETGKLVGPYAEVIRKIKLKHDPEYQKYLELKERFEGKDAK